MSIQDRTRYQLWEHVPTRAIFAIRRTGGQITGCLGPYSLAVARQTDITELDYDADQRWVKWARREAEAHNFDLTG
jgi:hypothetical protein